MENDVAVTHIRQRPQPGMVAIETSRGIRFTRFVGLATGFEGDCIWCVLDVVSATLPQDRYDHAYMPIDFAWLRGQLFGSVHPARLSHACR